MTTEVIVDYAKPCMDAEKALKDAHDAVLNGKLELAMTKWIRQESDKPAPDLISYRRILGELAVLEERTGNLPRALDHYSRLKLFSPQPQAVQQRIDELRAKLPKP